MSDEILNNNLQSKTINFIKKNLKNLSIFSIIFILLLFSLLFYKDFKKKNEIIISAEYMQATIQYKEKKINDAKNLLENVINKNHKFYSPLALYFIIDNNLEKNSTKIIKNFDKILSISSINKENLNLIRIKKAMFLFSLEDEELIIKTLNPIINSESIWRDMAIELISNYFLSKGEKKKSNEYIQLMNKKD
jgi:predicted negative regulator of RcsB-dependent stress response